MRMTDQTEVVTLVEAVRAVAIIEVLEPLTSVGRLEEDDLDDFQISDMSNAQIREVGFTSLWYPSENLAKSCPTTPHSDLTVVLHSASQYISPAPEQLNLSRLLYLVALRSPSVGAFRGRTGHTARLHQIRRSRPGLAMSDLGIQIAKSGLRAYQGLSGLRACPNACACSNFQDQPNKDSSVWLVLEISMPKSRCQNLEHLACLVK